MIESCEFTDNYTPVIVSVGFLASGGARFHRLRSSVRVPAERKETHTCIYAPGVQCLAQGHLDMQLIARARI